MDPSELDHLARNRFSSEIRNNFSVIANAGAGKTRAIVDRVAAVALSAGDEILPKLVVVTYANSAAHVLKRRVRSALLERLSDTSARTILSSLERTFFGTIHGFCFKLLREFQFHLNLPRELTLPSLKVREQLWQQFVSGPELNQRFADDPLVRQLLRFCSWQALLDLAARIARPRQGAAVAPEPPVPELSSIRRCWVPSQSWAKKEQLVRDLERLVAGFDQKVDHSFLDVPTLDSGNPEMVAAWQSTLSPLLSWLEEASLSVANQLAAEFRSFCYRQGIVTFDDQIDLCRELLNDAEVLAQIRRRQYTVILDEAQDTGSAMFEILIEITRSPGEKVGTWPQNGSGPAPGRFCLVGDPRQTIYDRAGLAIYRAVNQAFSEKSGGELLFFYITRRCSLDVVATVNRIFSGAAITKNEIRYDDLVARPGTGKGYAGRLQLLPPDLEVKNVDQIFADETRQLSVWLSQQGKAGLGLDSWNQVAILAPRHEWLTACADQLRKHDLPYIYRHRKMTWGDVPAFSWPAALIYTLLHPWDRFERLGVLREIFAVADTDLVIWSRTPANVSAAVEEAQQILDQLEQELNGARPMTLGRLVENIIRTCRLDERLSAIGTDPRDLDLFREQAFAADVKGFTPYQWVDELLGLLNENASVQPATADAIELSTSHSAKGLEWDIVIPLGFGRRIYPGDSTAFPRLVQDDAVQQVVWGPDSPGAQRIERDEETFQRRHRQLLYVTLTRARFALLLPNILYRDSRRSFREASGFDLAEIAQIVTPLPRAREAQRERWLQTELALSTVDFSDAAERSADLPELIRPHTLVNDPDTAEAQFTEQADSYDYGRWWHLWVEQFPWRSPRAEQEKYVRSIHPELPFFARASVETERFFHSPDILEVIRQGSWFRSEVSFSAPENEKRWIEGIIDLVLGTAAGEIWIIDWKTNQKNILEPEIAFAAALREKYQPQLFAYQKVLEQTFNRKVTRLLLYSTVLGRFV